MRPIRSPVGARVLAALASRAMLGLARDRTAAGAHSVLRDRGARGQGAGDPRRRRRDRRRARSRARLRPRPRTRANRPTGTPTVYTSLPNTYTNNLLEYGFTPDDFADNGRSSASHRRDCGVGRPRDHRGTRRGDARRGVRITCAVPVTPARRRDSPRRVARIGSPYSSRDCGHAAGSFVNSRVATGRTTTTSSTRIRSGSFEPQTVERAEVHRTAAGRTRAVRRDGGSAGLERLAGPLP